MNRKEAYWFARGYYDGRTFGNQESLDAVEGWGDEVRLAYKQGYDNGVADYIEMDVDDGEV